MIKYQALILTLFFIIISSCSEEDEPGVNNPGKPTLAEDLSDVEIQYINDLMSVEAEMGNYWKGFNCIRDTPIILITDKHEALIFNIPDRYIRESTPVPSVTATKYGLTLHRNTELRGFAQKIVSPQLFYFYEEYEGLSYYIYDITYKPSRTEDDFYFDYKNRNGKFHISVFYHELFHIYSLFKGERSFGTNSENLPPQQAYPINNESLPFIILLFNVMIDAYHVQSESDKRKYLGYYVSIHNEIQKLDTTSDGNVRIGFHQEKTEGAARYVEVFSTLQTINNNTIDDPTHGYGNYAENITESHQIRGVYGQRMFYHTGAGAIHLLKELGYPEIEKELFIPNNSPFFIAKRFLNLDQEILDKNLEELQTLYNWNAIVERSEFLLALD